MHGHAKRFYPRPMRSRFIFEDWFVGSFVVVLFGVFPPGIGGEWDIFVFNFHFLATRIFPCHVRMQLQQ